MNIYISGPITGTTKEQRNLFYQAEEAMYQEFGVDIKVFNPMNHERFSGPEEDAWVYYMRASIKDLALCDTIVMLPGWSNSKGARIEHELARALNFRILDWVRFINEPTRETQTTGD